MRKYIYKPLDKPNSEFRLLRISKHPLIDLPQCSLQKYSLTDCPEYTALSYTWGKPTATYRVAIEAANIEVRQNLFDFLDAYTTEPWGMDNAERPVFYWIDQICINQEDPIERSGQVRIMDKIYRQANMVLIWLGCDPNMIEAVRRLQNESFSNRHLASDDDGWALATLLAHPYFSRIWVIQEIALSVNPPLVVCGGVELNWIQIRYAMGSAPSHSPTSAENIIYARSRNRHTRSLEECIQAHCENDCQDPRDKVYGLLGLTPERWRVRIDYRKEVLEVYFDTVVALFEELFDVMDPECLYPKELSMPVDYESCRETLVVLGKAMGLPQHQLGGLSSFLRYIQRAYLSTKIRNVQYTYTGRIYTRKWAHIPPPSAELSPICECIASGACIDPAHRKYPQTCSEKVEVSGESIKVTRRNPLMRDIIPKMGLQFASRTVESIAGECSDSVPALDRWWCKYEDRIHYFDCGDEGAAGMRGGDRPGSTRKGMRRLGAFGAKMTSLPYPFS